MTVCDPAPHQPRATRADWPLAHAPGRTSAERSSPFLYELHPSRRDSDEAASRRRQDRMALGRTLPLRRLHGHQHRRPAANAVALYTKRRTWELWMNKGKGVIRLMRLS
jgi:hypothetical protein